MGVRNTDYRSTRVRGAATVALIGLVLHASAKPVAAQQSVGDVLSFLLTNRSVQTGDFQQDEQAAAAARDSIAQLLLSEISTLPIGSSAAGFAYRVDPTLGTLGRSSDNFGPFFAERSLTVGPRRVSISFAYQDTEFDSIDGRDLRNGTFISTASTVHGSSAPFDVESLTLSIHARTMTLSSNYGISDRLDVSASLPFITLSVSGERIDTYRGTSVSQARASVSDSGQGDLLLRAKYNVLRRGASGFSIAAESRLPTGDQQNLLGTGSATIMPMLIGSLEERPITLHGNCGFSFGGLSDEFDYAGAVSAATSPRLTLVGEIDGRWFTSLGRLTDLVQPRPGLVGIDTIRLSSAPGAAGRAVAVAGVKWNVGATWLMSASVIRAITTTGLNARWTPTLTIDYAF
jgi:hypothetical protein